MTTYREELLTKVIYLFGYESKVTIAFAHACENWAHTLVMDNLLASTVQHWEENFEND